jgi:hypothetical protein
MGNENETPPPAQNQGNNTTVSPPVPAVIVKEKKEVQILQNSTEFKPNQNQIKWLNTALALQSLSPLDIEKECHLSRTTFYVWRHIPGFNEWFKKEFEYSMEIVRQELIKSGVDNARKDHKWWRDMMVISGVARPEQFEQQEAKPINQVNLMAAAFTKGAAERNVVIDGNSTGAVPPDSQNGPAEGH